jgi:hypothetical protein
MLGENFASLAEEKYLSGFVLDETKGLAKRETSRVKRKSKWVDTFIYVNG